MRRTTFAMSAALCFVFALASGCGDKDRSSSQKPKQPSEAVAPEQLVGEYAMTLRRDDLPPNPPPELTDGSKTWTLKIANTGGPSNGPALTIVNDKLGPLESSRFGVVGQRILLHEQECDATGEAVESEYDWTVKGRTLTFAGGKGACRDKVALTLLTANPWTKKG